MFHQLQINYDGVPISLVVIGALKIKVNSTYCKSFVCEFQLLTLAKRTNSLMKRALSSPALSRPRALAARGSRGCDDFGGGGGCGDRLLGVGSFLGSCGRIFLLCTVGRRRGRLLLLLFLSPLSLILINGRIIWFDNQPWISYQKVRNSEIWWVYTGYRSHPSMKLPIC